MRILVLTTAFLSLGILSYAQTNNRVYKDECIVTLEKYSGKGFRQNSEKPKELGKIDVSGVTEGSTISRRYKIDKKSIYAHIELFFEDDLRYEDSLTDAVTLWIFITNGPRRSARSALALTRTQSSYDEGFNRLIVSALGKKNGVFYGINVDCQAHFKSSADEED